MHTLPEAERLSSRQVWYRSVYLRSPHWHEIRKAKFAESKHCVGCKCISHLDVHHLSYKNLGHEPLIDLVVLCRSCHKDIHETSAREAELKKAMALNAAIIPPFRAKHRSRAKQRGFKSWTLICLQAFRNGSATPAQIRFLRNHSKEIITTDLTEDMPRGMTAARSLLSTSRVKQYRSFDLAS